MIFIFPCYHFHGKNIFGGFAVTPYMACSVVMYVHVRHGILILWNCIIHQKQSIWEWEECQCSQVCSCVLCVLLLDLRLFNCVICLFVWHLRVLRRQHDQCLKRSCLFFITLFTRKKKTMAAGSRLTARRSQISVYCSCHGPACWSTWTHNWTSIPAPCCLNNKTSNATG